MVKQKATTKHSASSPTSQRDKKNKYMNHINSKAESYSTNRIQDHLNALEKMPPHGQLPYKSEVRISGRKQGLASESYPPTLDNVYLPKEIRFLILDNLEKKDLKQVRLVSKNWNSVATIPLFDTVYISPHEKNMQVFEFITQHPVICHAVKRLVYDTNSFRPNITPEDYWVSLEPLFFGIADRWRNESFNCPDVNINQLVEESKDHLFSGSIGSIQSPFKRRNWRQPMQTKFIRKGWQNYNANAAYEHREFNCGRFYVKLCTGIRCLSRLHGAALSETGWTCSISITRNFSPEDYGRHCTVLDRQPLDCSTFYGPQSGSPLVRSWHPFHVQPTSSQSEIQTILNNHDHFQMLTRALAKSDKTLISLDYIGGHFSTGIPASAFTSPYTMDVDLNVAKMAYSNLEQLDITISEHSSNDLSRPQPLTALPQMLGAMRNLRRLHLEFMHLRRYERIYRYDEIFPPGRIGSKLTHLSIAVLSFKAREFLTLVWRHPHLRELTLRNLDLSQGCWAGVIEALAYSGLSGFYIDGNLFHNEFPFFFPDVFFNWGLLGEDSIKLRDEIQHYVVHGGRHPCLMPDSPPSTQLQWVNDLFSDKFKEGVKLWAKMMGYNTKQYKELGPKLYRDYVLSLLDER
ncbi:hypothetical protein ACLMJK_007110 [Lecanora helva]